MKTLRAIIYSLALGLNSCASVEGIPSVFEAVKTPESIESQDLERVIFEGDLELSDGLWNIPNGMHHFKLYQNEGQDANIGFLEGTYRDGRIDKYFSVYFGNEYNKVPKDGYWKYVEEVHGDSISLIQSRGDFKGIMPSELEMKLGEHDAKVQVYLNKICLLLRP